MEQIESTIRKAYDCFNRRDIDGVLSELSADVKWANGWKGGYVYGYDGIREYWTAQWKELDPRVYPVNVRKSSDGNAEVEVHQVVKDLQGTLIFDGTVRHYFTFRDGLISGFHLER